LTGGGELPFFEGTGPFKGLLFTQLSPNLRLAREKTPGELSPQVGLSNSPPKGGDTGEMEGVSQIGGASTGRVPPGFGVPTHFVPFTGNPHFFVGGPGFLGPSWGPMGGAPLWAQLVPRGIYQGGLLNRGGLSNG